MNNCHVVRSYHAGVDSVDFVGCVTRLCSYQILHEHYLWIQLIMLISYTV